MTEQQALIVLAYADNDMSLTRASRELPYHIHTVDHHLSRVHKATGKDPRRFYDLVELVPIAKAVLENK